MACRPRRLIAALVLALAAAPVAAQETLANRLFGAVAAPTGTAGPIGTHARGCAEGLVAMPASGPTWAVMRPSRNRAWGAPVTVDFLQDLSRAAAAQGWAGLYVGDISQPRGGPMTSGHTSHQIGLDADIWMLPPRRLNLSRAERESLSSISVRNAAQTDVNAAWTPAHAAILRAAAEDRRVDRIFVTPPVKVALCRAATRADRGWLQKIRPWYGHDTHFHVRLRCPRGARGCVNQTPTVAELSNGGDGCDASLAWWVTDYLEALKNPPPPDPAAPPPPRGARAFTLADLPAQCAALVAAP
ncbi:MAG: penicillin-insensitive murein endopeptidase [Rhodobacteraceae bacterium]|nr:penicillin-insensitive murein endopeptidase [Paracoccaceae bacterium]